MQTTKTQSPRKAKAFSCPITMTTPEITRFLKTMMRRADRRIQRRDAASIPRSVSR